MDQLQRIEKWPGSLPHPHPAWITGRRCPAQPQEHCPLPSHVPSLWLFGVRARNVVQSTECLTSGQRRGEVKREKGREGGGRGGREEKGKLQTYLTPVVVIV